MGGLILCATPIGNLDDMSRRAIDTLRDADIVACEDTRRARKLFAHFGLTAKGMVVYNEATEERKATDLVKRIAAGRTVVLISDAGMPGLSDPGFRLVTACIAEGLHVGVVPGPNAAIAALVVSGLPPARFVFEGFLPRKKGDRRRRFETLVDEQRTIVFYESPHRIEECLVDLFDVLGDRPVALARELTKMYEEVRRGSASALIESVRAEPPRGEMVVVVQGAVRDSRVEPSTEELAARARSLMDGGVPRKDALAQVARESDVSKRKVFDALVEEKS
ncbi:MAG: 16S rRNA (cytidine(1402)-2'-O)-methyltransferase [Actinomycetota bacterium]